MNVQSITEDLENIAVSIAERSQIEFRSDRESFGGDLLERGFDSLDFVELIMSLEEEFSNPSQKIEIPDEDAEKIVTVQDAIDYLRDQGIEDD